VYEFKYNTKYNASKNGSINILEWFKEQIVILNMIKRLINVATYNSLKFLVLNSCMTNMKLIMPPEMIILKYWISG
jgi:hypothetical protein